jgi:hypothetical protein
MSKWRLDDRRAMSMNEYSDPGICIGVDLPDVGFVSIASVVYGCAEAKELGDQMEIAARIVKALNAPAPSFAWPALDEELRHILGKPCFALINIAELLRFDGYAIRQRAEDEKAVCLHWLLGLYFQRGAAWADEGDKQLKAINQRRIARLDEIKQQAT